MSAQHLVRYDAMISAIAECHRVDEVKDLRDKARAMEIYAAQSRNLEAERQAAGVRLRAERRCGQLLKEQAASGERHNGHGDHKAESQAATPVLADLGITKTQSSRWQALAEVPEAEFEKLMGDPVRKPTTTGIIATAKPATTQVPVARLNDEALWLWGRMREFEQRGYFDADIGFLYDEMTPAMQADVCRLCGPVLDLFTALKGVCND